MNIRKIFPAFLLLVSPFIPLTVNGMENESLLFKWAVVIRDNSKNIDTTTYANTIVLKAHESFKFILQPGKNTHVYLYYYSDTGELSVLFFQQHNSINGNSENEWYEIPRGIITWFEYTNPADNPDTYYLLVSDKPLRNLESLTDSLLKTAEDKSGIQTEVLKEIMRLIKEDNVLLTNVEMPVPLSGIIKAESLDVFEIKDISFYAKVITITGEKAGGRNIPVDE